MQTDGSGPDSPLIAILATLPVTANGHPGNLGFFGLNRAFSPGGRARPCGESGRPAPAVRLRHALAQPPNARPTGFIRWPAMTGRATA